MILRWWSKGCCWFCTFGLCSSAQWSMPDLWELVMSSAIACSIVCKFSCRREVTSRSICVKELRLIPSTFEPLSLAIALNLEHHCKCTIRRCRGWLVLHWVWSNCRQRSIFVSSVLFCCSHSDPRSDRTKTVSECTPTSRPYSSSSHIHIFPSPSHSLKLRGQQRE